jgi:hypothetical protein
LNLLETTDSLQINAENKFQDDIIQQIDKKIRDFVELEEIIKFIDSKRSKTAYSKIQLYEDEEISKLVSRLLDKRNHEKI